MRTIRTTTAGLVLAVSLSAGSVGLAGAASAAPAQPGPPHFKMYRTWHAAQKAAGFQLLKPTNTDGLRRVPGIAVGSCRFQRPAAVPRHRFVLAMYLRHPRPRLLGQMINFTQGLRSAGRPCIGPFPGPGGKVIAKVKVDGVIALLSRGHVKLCIKPVNGKPRCRSRVILQLRWTAHRHWYQITSLGERRRVIVRFARSLVAVK